MPETFTSNDLTKKLKPRRPPRNTGLLLSVIALILALGGIGIGSSIAIWRHLNTHQFERQLAELRTDLQQSQAPMQATLNANQADIAQLSQKFTEATSQKNISEAAYLIRLANIHLLVEKDSAVALQLLKMARQQLKSSSQESLVTLKEAIDQDITTLSASAPVEVTKLSDQLDQLKIDVGNLSLLPSKEFSETTPAKTEPTPEEKNWWEKLKYNLGGLKKLFVIRRIDHPTSPLLEPQQTLFLKENIQLKLTQAQWALINKNSSLYQKSLSSAIQWLAEYDSNQTETAALIKRIQTLDAVDIEPTLPSLKSLQALALANTSVPEKKT
ncbi:uroporphyrinogen-III C-methyltransferase [Candidatus Coxiella mudrowiae]|uniref:Uroporphyrin-III C-methyltransferase n=1 Tax=Candidatus Coxiella mudrowiae TaxID=2054173 RepID=A0ABM5UVS1_9COXI|nr:uroporphyrinogen-III C-methyltransferase [Candidatus Coxiella mudrowiae]AKQ34029.1 Uroporphyrin-III C-methyltransferase [Candidatus Coxiella mudrowiae]